MSGRAASALIGGSVNFHWTSMSQRMLFEASQSVDDVLPWGLAGQVAPREPQRAVNSLRGQGHRLEDVTRLVTGRCARGTVGD